MRITIETLPHENQRYDTCGDWVFTNHGNDLDINISEMKDKRSEFAVAIHELVEAFLCQMAGITDKQVDEWDMNYSGEYDEPGEDPNCPYVIQHLKAETIERLVVTSMNMTWGDHERNVDALSTSVSGEHSRSSSDSD